MHRPAVLVIVLAAACGGTPVSAPAPVQPARPIAALPPAPVADPPAEPPGLRLPRHVQPIAYRATVRVDPATEAFTGEIEIDVEVSERSRVIWLHGRRLAIGAATAEQARERIELVATPHGDDLLALESPQPLVGRWTLKLGYRGAQDPVASAGLFRQQEAGHWYAFTQLEAIYARRVFPCFDEPDRKTPWTLTLEVPAGLTALANTQATGEAPAGPGWKRVTFAPTRPLPSYLIAFAVGPFELVDAGRSRTGVPIRIATTQGRRAHAALAVEVVPKALAGLEDYFDDPYPYDKLDFVPIPQTVGFGCMENPGLVTCNQRRMLFDPARSTPDDRRAIAFAAAHELAHQWFGNIVTMAWWDDIWLNEGLATWIQGRIIHAIDPRPDDALVAADSHARAIAADRLATARAVRQPIETVDDILTAFDGVSYSKAGAVIAMFERWIGAETFQRGVRAYVKKHAHGVVTTADFIAAIAEASGRDLSGLQTFLDQPGAPHLRVDLRCETGKPPILQVKQSRYLPPGAAAPAVASAPWTIPLCVAHDRAGSRAETCAVIREASAEVALDATGCPRWILPNAGGIGHYRLTMTPALVEQVIRVGWARLTPVERSVLATEVGAMVRAGELDVAVGMRLVPRLLREDNSAALEDAGSLATVRQFVPAARMAAYDRWLVKTFGPDARRLGWLRKPGEAVDVDRRRKAIVPILANAGDPAAHREVVRLARRWRDLAPDARGLVLGPAARAEVAIHDLLFDAALAEPDRDTRRDLYAALSWTRDPDRVRKTLGLLLDPRVDVREVTRLPFGFSREPERTIAETFVRDHLEAILARLPESGTTGGGRAFLVGVFTSACDPARRDEIAAFVTERFGKLPGGARVVAQWIESMDQCIATRAQLGPQLDRWLATRP